jgi:hypothetical protein
MPYPELPDTSTIYVFSMSYLENVHNKVLILDQVYNLIPALTNAVFLFSSKFLTT